MFFIPWFCNQVGSSWFRYLQTTLFSCVLYSAILRESGIKLIQISSNHFIFLRSLFSDFAREWDQADSYIFRPRYFPAFRDFVTKWDQADLNICKLLYFPAFFISQFRDKVRSSWYIYLQTTLVCCILYSVILQQTGIKLIQVSSNDVIFLRFTILQQGGIKLIQIFSNHFIFLRSLFRDFATKSDQADSNIFKPLFFLRSLIHGFLTRWDQADSNVFKPLYFPAFFIWRFCDKVGSSWFKWLQTTLFSSVLYFGILRQSQIEQIQISSNHFIFLHSLFRTFVTKWDQADSNIFKPVFFISWFCERRLCGN